MVFNNFLQKEGQKNPKRWRLSYIKLWPLANWKY